MLKLVSDADVHGAVPRALLDEPGTDFIRVQAALPEGALDPQVLEWAAAEDRVLLTNDRSTMIAYALQRVRSGLPMPGLIVLPPHPWIAKALEDIRLIAGVCSPDELRDRIVFLPLKPGDLRVGPAIE